MATISLAVTVSNPGSGNKYYIDGVLQATVSMTPGNTYKFDQSDSSNSGHPLRLSTTSNGTHNSGSEYTTGVTTAGTPGSSGAYTQIEVTATTVQTLYYYCTNHSGMGGSISVGNASTKSLKELSGFNVQNKSSDPVPYAQELNNNPYGGVWSSGGNLNTARNGIVGASHSPLTSGLAYMGQTPGGTQTITEKYDGSSWTEVADLSTARTRGGGGGTQTSALASSGYSGTAIIDPVEEFNGSAWSEVAELNTDRYSVAAWGANAEANIVVGGLTPPSSKSALAEQFNGTAWTEVGDLNTARTYMGGFGTSYTSGLVAGGSPQSANETAIAESWNGSTWTEVSDLNEGRTQMAGYGTSSSNGYVVGGYDYSPANAGSTKTENYDGSSWTEVNDLGTARWDLGAGGAPTSAIAFGGDNPGGKQNATEEWTFSGLPPSTPAAAYSDAIVGEIYYNSSTGEFKAIKDGGAPIGSWASGGNLNQVRGSNKGFGTQTAAIDAGGVYSPISPPGAQSNYVESYDGTSWTEVAEINTARQAFASAGTATAGIIALGYKIGANAPETELWNGSTWTETADANTARTSVRGCGTTTAALAIGGYNPPPSLQLDITESWNGSAWTEVNDMNTRRSGAGIALSSPYSDTIIFGGYTQPPPNTANAETWNGSSWTETGNLNTAKDNMGGSGNSSTSALCFGGRTLSQTEGWNGTAWSEVSDLALARGYAASAGSATSALFSGGEAPGSPYYRNNTEEWTAADFEIKTMTTS